MSEIDSDPALKLSRLQKNILLDLFHKKDCAKQEQERRGRLTTSDRVVFCRTLRRLRQRGLIEYGGGRANRAKPFVLTPCGREIASDLQELADWYESIIRSEKERMMENKS